MHRDKHTMSKLYVVATPIGNLEDVTLRAIRNLGEVDVVFAEDTRVTKKLFDKYDINTKLISLNARTESAKASKVIDILAEGKSAAYVTDAGTPGISDPGTLLASRVRGAGFDVVAIPGPSALATAVSVAGVPANEFLFLGFLPHKKGRETKFAEISESKRSVVFYESPHRILKTLQSLSEHLGEQRNVVLVRELTKIHEEVLPGVPSELLEILEQNPEKQRGEFVVIVSAK